MMNLHCSSSKALLVVTIVIVFGINFVTANKTKSCKDSGCGQHKFCNLQTGNCEQEYENCLTTLCRSGFYCENGKCIEDKCNETQIQQVQCGLQEECYLNHVQCVTTPCPPIPSCRQIDLCPLIDCKPDHVCKNNECIKETCDETKIKQVHHVKCVGRSLCLPIPLCRPFDQCIFMKCSAGYICKNSKCIKLPIESISL